MFKAIRTVVRRFNTNKPKINQSSESIVNMSFFKWTAVILGVNGLGFVLYMATQDDINTSFSRMTSKASGQLATCNIPVVLRKPLFNSFAKVYNVIQDDMLEPNYENYKNFQEFFTRKVKQRQFSLEGNDLITPADSKVLSFTEIRSVNFQLFSHNQQNETLLVKNINYRLGHFLVGNQNYVINEEIMNAMKKSPNKDQTKLYSIIFYLAPGDYHRYICKIINSVSYHAPSDYCVKSRNHIAGFLQPVKVDLVEKKAGIYETNERVGIFGTYPYGFLGMVFVGALNVGSMTLNFDQELITNKSSINQYREQKFFQENNEQGIQLKKGDEIGMFKLGSTIVMIFEAKNVDWKVKPGDKVRWGQTFAIVS